MDQTCRIFDMGYKEVIDLETGARLGYVYDAEIELETGKVKTLYAPGPARAFGLLGREEDVAIPWENIEKIGDDIILVRGAVRPSLPPKPGFPQRTRRR